MEINWIIVTLVIVAVIALIIFLILQNQKDKKALMKHLIDEDNIYMSKKPDNDELEPEK